MRAEDVLKTIRELPQEERDKVFLGIMKDFNQEMMQNPVFMQHAVDVMHKFMDKRRESGTDTSVFEDIAKK